MERENLNNDLVSLQFETYPKIFEKFKELSQAYGGMPVGNLVQAFGRVSGQQIMLNNPYIQNRRVKQISSLPKDYTKDQVADMITEPDANEQSLRSVHHALEYTAYPMMHLREVYQNLLTYHSYFAPIFADKEETSRDDFWREWKLLEKLRIALDPKARAHEIAGQAIQEGKVFYVPRISMDKPHNKINYAFMQQLPSDWTKIVGFNSVSKYTVAFNLCYFLKPGNDPMQFGDLFLPYLGTFSQIADVVPAKDVGSSMVFAEKGGLNLKKFNDFKQQGYLDGDPDVYYQGGKWFYWVTLPVDKVFTFEIDDVNRNVVSPLTGLYISMIQLAQLEQIQLELVQNPLVSIMTGEIPYTDDRNMSVSDPYKLSNAGRNMFEALWYQMLNENNTNGIGLYMAPLEHMTLHNLAETPSAMEVAGNGYSYTIAKAGLSGIIPTAEDPKAGLANISFQIESKFAENIYRDFERMIRAIMAKMNLKYEWRFRMFGDLATDADVEDQARQGMTLGILPEAIVYNALHDRSIFEDMAISDAILNSKLMDKRRPLVTSYTAKNPDSGLPPQAAHDANPGGRPSSDGKATSEGQEQDIDQGV